VQEDASTAADSVIKPHNAPRPEPPHATTAASRATFPEIARWSPKLRAATSAAQRDTSPANALRPLKVALAVETTVAEEAVLPAPNATVVARLDISPALAPTRPVEVAEEVTVVEEETSITSPRVRLAIPVAELAT